MSVPIFFFAQTHLAFVLTQASNEARGILIVLAFFSVFAWYTMIFKAMQMSRAKKLNQDFEAAFRKQESVLEIFSRQLAVSGCPFFEVYQGGCAELKARLKAHAGGAQKSAISLGAMEHVKRALEGAVARESLKLESGLILLAIAVSGAPFLGLLGTVWGVMDTFAGVAVSHSADLVSMAPGVSAALITTVAGLLVAIPSMFGYNWLVHTLRVRTVELDNFAQDLLSKMETECLKED